MSLPAYISILSPLEIDLAFSRVSTAAMKMKAEQEIDDVARDSANQILKLIQYSKTIYDQSNGSLDSDETLPPTEREALQYALKDFGPPQAPINEMSEDLLESLIMMLHEFVEGRVFGRDDASKLMGLIEDIQVD